MKNTNRMIGLLLTLCVMVLPSLGCLTVKAGMKTDTQGKSRRGIFWVWGSGSLTWGEESEIGGGKSDASFFIEINDAESDTMDTVTEDDAVGVDDVATDEATDGAAPPVP